MSLNHRTPPPSPAPGPLCFIYKPQLALLALGKLDDDQANDVRAHLADCEYCQLHLREYEIVREAVARHFGAEAAAGREGALPGARVRSAAPAADPPLTLEEIMQAAEDTPPVSTAERPSPARQPSPRQRRLTALGAVAAVLVLSILAASLFTHSGPRPPVQVATPTPIPTWATAGPSTLKGTLTQFRVPTPGADPNDIVAGPDGNLWFTEAHANKIGRSTPQGGIAEFAVPTPDSGLTAIAAGPDGNLWFTESIADTIGRITPRGAIAEFAIPTAAAQPLYIAAGPDGNLWFTEAHANKIGRITPQGRISEFAVPTADAGLSGITAAVDGNVWFVEYNPTIIGRITPQGAIKEFDAQFRNLGAPAGPTFRDALPDQPLLLARAANGVWWNWGYNGLGYMAPDGIARVVYGPKWTPDPAQACNATSGNLWAGPDGALWGWTGCLLERLTVAPWGQVPYGTPSYQVFTVPNVPDVNHLVLAPLADGTVWFVGQSTDQIGRLT
jgi:virginiamycin B lyase